MTENNMDISEYLEAFRQDEAEFLSEDLGDRKWLTYAVFCFHLC